MIELSQLKQLVTIVESGTISSAAELLFLSQPALSRSMQKLEEDIGVPIFSRKKNKLTLNENGKLTYELAKKLLDDFSESVERVRTFDRANRTIFVGSCAPAPLWKIIPLLTSHFPDKTISYEMKDVEHAKSGLLNGPYQIAILNKRLDEPDILSHELCREQLYLCLPNGHPLSKYKNGISFREIDGITMLLYNEIGFWHFVHKSETPNTRYIIQSDRQNFDDLVKESNLPSFITDLSMKEYGTPENKTFIPITDETATQTFYANYPKKNKGLFYKLFQSGNI